ncbi:TPX2 protein family [Corchorus capsularis]|uniref:TPX2 protein family n=1 Tax=Corchorus capsularis TaxID=210143 RepID=A0A1R3HSA8_COCAP|nr:TPX2 protein family [Corchorus capsularis]
MEVAKNSKLGTPVKDPAANSQSKTQKFSKSSENSNPNISHSSSPLTKSAKPQKHASKNPVVYSPRNKLRERKFVVAKKNSKKERSDSNPAVSVDCKCKEKFGGNIKKCLCVAYENLRASQEEFFKNKAGNEAEEEVEKEKGVLIEDLHEGYGSDNQEFDEIENSNQTGSSTVKRRRDKLMEEARNSAPESGKVMHLVKAFEKLLSIPNAKESEKKEDDEKEPAEEKKEISKKKPVAWALPGLQPPKVPEADAENQDEVNDSSSSFCPSDFVLTAENLGLDRRFSVSSSWDSSQGSISSRTSNGGRRSRRNSSDSVGTFGGRRWKKQLKPTSQKPFKLRTEQRGKVKEEEFMKKIQEMMAEEEKLRIPIAQGLPWTTDEPEVLIKPPVKEHTIPVDLRLHSDVRAVERAEFDHQVAEKMSLMEQYKMERERQQKMAEEEEIKRLRKELVPKAQPMPYFDRPFIPRRSSKHPTIPREPKFHMPHHKKIKCCISWNDLSSTYSFQGSETREI